MPIICPCCNSPQCHLFLDIKAQENAVSSWGVEAANRKIYICAKCQLHFAETVFCEEDADASLYAEDYQESMSGEGRDSGLPEQSEHRINLVRKLI